MVQYYESFRELYNFKNGKTREPKRYEEPVKEKPAKKKPSKKKEE